MRWRGSTPGHKRTGREPCYNSFKRLAVSDQRLASDKAHGWLLWPLLACAMPFDVESAQVSEPILVVWHSKLRPMPIRLWDVTGGACSAPTPKRRVFHEIGRAHV